MTSRQLFLVLLVCSATSMAHATMRRVPQESPTIQAAIDAAQPGDTVIVASGRYQERLRLKPEIVVRSDGDRGGYRDDCRKRTPSFRSSATVVANTLAGYRTTVNAKKATVMSDGNRP